MHPTSSLCSTWWGLSILPVLETLNWHWNLFYCYMYLYSITHHYSVNAISYTKNEWWNIVLTHSTQLVGWNDSNKCIWGGHYHTLALISGSQCHSKMQLYSLILHNIEGQLCPRKDVTKLMTNSWNEWLC
jgi:hypothetical protein